MVLRTKEKEVSDRAPFSTFLQKRLTLERDVWLVKNLESFSYEHINLIVDDSTNLYEGVTVVKVLEKGTPIIFNKAKIFTNGVSGVSHCILLGTVNVESKEMQFEYRWGEKSILLDSNTEDYWTFPKPIWNGEEFDQKYYFK